MPIDLGALMPMDSNQPQAGDPTSSWTEFIKANRPFLAGMGAQLMVGSPGNVLSNIGAGMAKGNESQFLTEEHQRTVGNQERDFAFKQSEAEANRGEAEKDRKNRLQVADRTQEGRVAAAELRSDTLRYGYDKKYGVNGKADEQLKVKAEEQARKQLDTTVKDAIGWTPQERAAWIAREGANKYNRWKQAQEEMKLGAGDLEADPDLAQAVPPESGKGAGGTKGAVEKMGVQRKGTPTAPQLEPIENLARDYEKGKGEGSFYRDMQNPTGRQALRNKGYGSFVDNYERVNNLPSTGKPEAKTGYGGSIGGMMP